MRNIISIVLLVGMMVSGLPSAASEAAAASGPFTVTDALGRTVEFDALPQRIVVAGKAFFFIADALYLFPGAGERIAATGIFNQRSTTFLPLLDPSAAAKAVFETNVGVEPVAAAHPDVVILKSYLAGQLGAALEALNIPVVYVDLETPEQYARDVRILGVVLGQTARAEELVRYYAQAVEQIHAVVQDVTATQQPRVLLLQYSEKDGLAAFQVPPPGWMQTRLVELAGGIPVWRDSIAGKGWTTVTLEQIFAWDADVICIVAYSDDPLNVTQAIAADPNWRAMRAVKTENLYAFPGDLNIWDQPNPRWILGLTWLAQKLYPDRFVALDMLAVTRDFYRDLYGLDDEFFETQIRPTLTGDLP